MTKFSESFGANTFSDKSYRLGLTATVGSSQLIPGLNQQTYVAKFSFPENANVWVGLNVAPVLPTEGVVASQPNCALNPTAKFVRAGDTLYFISTAGVTDGGFELLSLGA